MKPWEAIISRGKKYRHEKKREKDRIIETHTQAKMKNLNSILQWTRMYSVTVYTFGE